MAAPISAVHISGLAPTVNFAGFAREHRLVQWGPRRIPDCQFFYVAEGRAELKLGGESYVLHAKDCAFYGPDTAHLLKLLEPTVYYSLHFHWKHEDAEPIHPAYRIVSCPDEDLADESPPFTVMLADYGSMRIPHKFSVPAIEPVLMKLAKEYQRAEPGHALMLRAYLSELLTLIVRGLLPMNTASPRSKIEPALDAVREHPERNWSVQELAGLCGYHPYYFSNLFKEIMGAAPKQYLIAERILKAKTLLLGGSSIDSVAHQLGYGSIHYFSRNFKETTGLTPTDFRQMGDAGR